MLAFLRDSFSVQLVYSLRYRALQYITLSPLPEARFYVVDSIRFIIEEIQV